jgi:hypothetical protein
MADVDSSPRRTVAQICAAAGLSVEGTGLSGADLTPPAYFDRLAAQGQYARAIRFLAHALPKRAAVWWGCLCVWHTARPDPTDLVAAVLRGALHWLQDPAEETRRAVERPARTLTLRQPAGCLGMAVFWSGGSMSAPHLPVVAPRPFLTARAVAGAVLTAAARPESFAARQQLRREFLAIGRRVAEGRSLWTSRGEPARPAVSPPETNGRPEAGNVLAAAEVDLVAPVNEVVP